MNITFVWLENKINLKNVLGLAAQKCFQEGGSSFTREKTTVMACQVYKLTDASLNLSVTSTWNHLLGSG